MWFTLSDQTAYFLWSLVLGAAAGALYDLLCALRVLLKAGRLCILISDVLFFALLGAATSLFALPFNKGSVRGFIVFGEAVGFLVQRLTIGRLTGRFYSILSKGIRRLLKKICELLKKFFDFLLKTAALLVYNIGVLKDKFGKRCVRIYQKHQKRRCRVRKNRSRTVRKAGRRTQNKKRRNAYEKRIRKEKKERSAGKAG